MAGIGGDNIFDLQANEIATGGSGSNFFEVGPEVGAATISLNSSGANELDFGSSVSDEDLWFAQNGEDLVIDEIGTSNQITVKNWYLNTNNQLNEITAGGLKLDSEISQLVSAMATFSAANSSFNPVTASQMPTDTALQSAVTASWHT
jgi:hypothetical protein